MRDSDAGQTETITIAYCPDKLTPSVNEIWRDKLEWTPESDATIEVRSGGCRTEIRGLGAPHVLAGGVRWGYSSLREANGSRAAARRAGR